MHIVKTVYLGRGTKAMMGLEKLGSSLLVMT